MGEPFAKDAERKMRKELAELEAEQSKATCWGAAVGERGKRIDALRRELARQTDTPDETDTSAEAVEAQVATLSPAAVTVSEEHIAARLWRAQAIDTGTPQSVVDARTPEAFKDQSEETRKTWLKFARTALRAIQENGND